MQAIGYLLLALLAIGPMLASGAKRLYAAAKARIPTASGGFLGVLNAPVVMPTWKAVAYVACFLLIGSGSTWQGCTLPDVGPIQWPTWGDSATQFIVLHDAAKDDEAFSKLAIVLQDQESAVGKKVVDSGWKVEVLDDESKDKNGNPDPLLKTLSVHGSITDAHRELLSISDKQKLLKRETLPADATAESVFAMMQARGKRK